MRFPTPRRVMRVLKRTLTRTIRVRCSGRPSFSAAFPVVGNTSPQSTTSAIQERLHNVPGLFLNLLEKFLELNQHIAPVYDLREIRPTELTSSYVIISSTTSLLAMSRSARNSATALVCDGDIPLVALFSSESVLDTAPSENPFRDSDSISLPSASISDWVSA